METGIDLEITLKNDEVVKVRFFGDRDELVAALHDDCIIPCANDKDEKMILFKNSFVKVVIKK